MTEEGQPKTTPTQRRVFALQRPPDSYRDTNFF